MRSCYGTIWPICAESAVKPQSTNLYLAITWSSSMTTLSAALCRELCMLCLCTTPSTYTPDWWTWWSDVEWITETERQCSSWLALSNSSVAYALARDCLYQIQRILLHHRHHHHHHQKCWYLSLVIIELCGGYNYDSTYDSTAVRCHSTTCQRTLRSHRYVMRWPHSRWTICLFRLHCSSPVVTYM